MADWWSNVNTCKEGTPIGLRNAELCATVVLVSHVRLSAPAVLYDASRVQCLPTQSFQAMPYGKAAVSVATVGT